LDKAKVNSDIMIESSRQNLRKSCISQSPHPSSGIHDTPAPQTAAY